MVALILLYLPFLLLYFLPSFSPLLSLPSLPLSLPSHLLFAVFPSSSPNVYLPSPPPSSLLLLSTFPRFPSFTQIWVPLVWSCNYEEGNKMLCSKVHWLPHDVGTRTNRGRTDLPFQDWYTAKTTVDWEIFALQIFCRSATPQSSTYTHFIFFGI